MPLPMRCRNAYSTAKYSSPLLSLRSSISHGGLSISSIPRRAESSVASPPTSPSPTLSNPPLSTTPSSSSPPLTQTLTWNRFLHLRAIRRRFNLAASLTTSLITTAAGVTLLSQQDLDKLGNILFGLDPIMAMGVGALGCGAVGWLLGPFAGNAAFGIWYRRLGPEIAGKEKAFYQRIKRYRADPSSQSMANPMPDYYGEKISSLQGYRQWLRDQRAFTKKRQSY
ncbi:TIM23 complex component [Lambiella insularis]|nr:TIM23 complex component [Lambiella insularis]